MFSTLLFTANHCLLPNIPPLLAKLLHPSWPMNIYSTTLSFASVTILDLWLCTFFTLYKYTQLCNEFKCVKKIKNKIKTFKLL